MQLAAGPDYNRPQYVEIDDDLYPLLRNHYWYVLRGGNGHPEVLAYIDGKRVRMHRYIWELTNGPIPDRHVIDHINRDSLDNRRANLRLATPVQNLANQSLRSNKTSRFRGVRRRGTKWVAQIQVNGRQRNLGAFFDETSAARAYDDAARRTYGEYAHLNFEE